MDLSFTGHPAEHARRLTAFAAEHRARGDLVVWLTARSFRPPVAADLVLLLQHWERAATLRDHCPSGPDSRTLAVVETLVRQRLSADQCFAYGDLCGDSPVFDLVGNPRVVACRPNEAARARARGLAVVDQLPSR